MQVKHIMSTEVIFVRREDGLDHVQELMTLHHFRHLPVLDSNEGLVGLVSHRNLLETSVSSLSRSSVDDAQHFISKISVEEMMTPNVVTIAPDEDLRKAAALMIDDKIECLPVVEKNRLVGIVTETDFLTLAWDVADATLGYSKSKKPRERDSRLGIS